MDARVDPKIDYRAMIRYDMTKKSPFSVGGKDKVISALFSLQFLCHKRTFLFRCHPLKCWKAHPRESAHEYTHTHTCLLYTSDAADDC